MANQETPDPTSRRIFRCCFSRSVSSTWLEVFAQQFGMIGKVFGATFGSIDETGFTVFCDAAELERSKEAVDWCASHANELMKLDGRNHRHYGESLSERTKRPIEVRF